MTVALEPVVRNIMLVSIRPQFVAQILNGSKTIELRRSRPLVRVGQRLAIYSTLPDGAMVATALVADITDEPKHAFWGRHRREVGVTKREFDDYFRDRESVVGIHLEGVRPLESPISLAQMRDRGIANPPQQWMYLDAREWDELL